MHVNNVHRQDEHRKQNADRNNATRRKTVGQADSDWPICEDLSKQKRVALNRRATT